MYAESKKNQNLALFDFDGTLCDKDSFTSFIFYALSKRHIVKQGLKTLPWIQAYFLNIYPAHAMRPKLFKAMFTGFSKSDADPIALEYAHSLQQHLNSPIYEQLIKHQLRGDRIAIVSASIDIYLKPISQILNVDLICTETEVLNQFYTGHYSSPDCSGEEKRQRILKQYDVDEFQSIYAYGNSYEDQAMLDMADYPYMVGSSHQLPDLDPQKKLA